MTDIVERNSCRPLPLPDQVAVALSNARLIEELDQLNWGTLKALARSIDTKSPRTAGHSERMTQLALRIGSVMGLPREKLDDLRRGGLLHDIGKIGVPASILNKAGPLTPEEHQLVMHHPRIGARILEPIPAYAAVLPMVLQHHERFDGKGYPDKLAGEALYLGETGKTTTEAQSPPSLRLTRMRRGGMGPPALLPLPRRRILILYNVTDLMLRHAAV